MPIISSSQAGMENCLLIDHDFHMKSLAERYLLFPKSLHPLGPLRNKDRHQPTVSMLFSFLPYGLIPSSST